MTTSISYTVAYLGSLAGALLLTPLSARVAKTLGVVDLPNARKIHATPTPRMGGAAIAVAMALVLTPLLLTVGWCESGNAGAHERSQALTLLLASVFILGVGLADDIFNLSSKYKLVALFGAALIVCATGTRINCIAIGNFSLPLHAMSWPITVLWITGVTVSVNFIDGLDGLAGGIAAIAAAVLAVGAAATGHIFTSLVILSLLGSLTGFLVFNFYPAKVFMGDCGSMFVGFVLSSSMVLCSTKSGATTGLLLPGLALSIPLLDTLLTFVRRSILQRRSLFSAERGHIHHRLVDMGLHQKHAVLLLYGVSVTAAVVGIAMHFAGHAAQIFSLVLWACALLLLFRAAGSVRARETLNAVRRNRAIRRESSRYRAVFEDMQTRFRAVRDFESWWTVLRTAAEQLDFTALMVQLVNRDGTPRLLRWSRTDTRFASCQTVRAALPIRQRRNEGPLRAEMEVAATTFLESAGERVALFSRLMGEHSLAHVPDATYQPPSHAELGELTLPSTRHNGNGNGHKNGNGHSRRGKQSAHALPDDLLESSIPSAPKPLKIAVVHDFLYTLAGAERVLEQILEVYPQADVFSLFDFLPADGRGFIKDKPVTTSFLQHMPFARTRHRAYLPLMPLAIEQLDVSAYDIIISSSYVAAKGVITRPGQLHVCYCHTPVRFAWELQSTYLGQVGMVRGIKSILARMILHYIRQWDVQSANRVDVFVTNSDFVGRRIEKIYRRESKTIYPPVDTEKFSLHTQKEQFYLTASRMVPYKRINLIVEAFTAMPDKRLIVVGDGPDFEKIKAIAGPNVKLVGYQPIERLKAYMQFAKAFVFAAEEDFGITPVEAQACGTPVIAYARGGVCESVVDGQTGLFFQEQTVRSLAQAVRRFERTGPWDPVAIRAHAQRFSAARFRDEFSTLVRREWTTFQADMLGSAYTGVSHSRDLDLPVPAVGPRILPTDSREPSVEGSVDTAVAEGA